MTNVIEMVKEMVNGKVDEVVFAKQNKEEIAAAFMWMDGHGHYYLLTEDDTHITMLPMKDQEMRAMMYEHLEQTAIKTAPNLHEVDMMHKVVEIDHKGIRRYHYFTTPEALRKIRFDLIHHITKVDLDVQYERGLVVIN